jgi:putative hydrolase of the HAD superfamily
MIKELPTFPAGIRNILFDLGNVLIDIDIPRTLDAFARLGIGGLDPSAIHPHQSGFFQEYELGNISEADFLRQIREDHACEQTTDAAIAEAWCALLTGIDPARFELLDRLRKTHRLFVLSNTNTLHIARVQALAAKALNGRAFESYFERCFYSHEMHLRKPDPAIYRRVIAEAGIVPAETLFIDDNACNLPEAAAEGLKIHHLSRGETVLDLFK